MPLNLIDIPATEADEQDQIAQRSTDRDADQVAMDGRVKILVTDWTNAGKPKQKDSPYIRLGVPKDQRSELKKIIRRAAVLNGVEPLYWQDTKPVDGIVKVKFTVGPKRVKANGDATATATATATAPPVPTPPPAADPNADQGGDQPQAQPEQRGRLLRR